MRFGDTLIINDKEHGTGGKAQDPWHQGFRHALWKITKRDGNDKQLMLPVETLSVNEVIDQEKIVTGVRLLFEAIGEDPEREGLCDTANRVARMYKEVFRGLHEDPCRHLKVVFDEQHMERPTPGGGHMTITLGFDRVHGPSSIVVLHVQSPDGKIEAGGVRDPNPIGHQQPACDHAHSPEGCQGSSNTAPEQHNVHEGGSRIAQTKE
jgi:hypothetical protein